MVLLLVLLSFVLEGVGFVIDSGVDPLRLFAQILESAA